MNYRKPGIKITAILLSLVLTLPFLFTEGFAAEKKNGKSVWTFKKALAEGIGLPEKIYPANYKKDSENNPLYTVEPGDEEYPDITKVEEFQPITAGSSEKVVIQDKWIYAWYSFTAEIAGTYIFSSDLHEFTRTTPDPLVVVFDESKEELTQSDDTELNMNFQVIIGLDEGETCYFAVTARNASGGKLEIPVTLAEKPDFEVASLTAEDYKLYAMDSYEEEDGKVYYDFQPASPDLEISLTLKDGSFYAGNIFDVLEELYIDYGFVPAYYSDIPQDEDNLLAEGMNENRGIIYLDNLKDPFYFNVIVKIADVTRIAGKLRWTTSTLIADKMKEALNIDKFDSMIIACGMDDPSGDKKKGKYPDALAGSYLAAVKNAPIILTSDSDSRMNKVVSYIQENLNSNGTVYILGGTSVVPEAMETKLKNKGISKVVRLAGGNRYQTSQAILNEAGIAKGQEILVCCGTNFADSLSASSTGLPILLVSDKDKTIENLQKRYPETFLTSLKNKKVSFTVIGGESAVSSELETVLKENYGAVRRVFGSDRYETSTAIAEDYFYDPTNVILAYAMNFPDGLCAGPLGYVLDAPVLLTRDKSAKIAASYIQSSSRLHNGYVTGGDTLISDNAVKTIFGTEPEFIISD